MIFIQLPNDASTSKYPRTFPQPLNLLSLPMVNNKIEIKDLALESFKKNKVDILKLLNHYAKKINFINEEVFINAGDYPPDAYYNNYYNYFFSLIKVPVNVIGSYLNVFPNTFLNNKYIKIYNHDYKF